MSIRHGEQMNRVFKPCLLSLFSDQNYFIMIEMSPVHEIPPSSGGRLPHFDANFCPKYAKILESPSCELRISLYILYIC